MAKNKSQRSQAEPTTNGAEVKDQHETFNRLMKEVGERRAKKAREMMEKGPQPLCKELDYAVTGGWEGAVTQLIHCLFKEECWVNYHNLSKHMTWFNANRSPANEAVVLTAILGSLASLRNRPPQYLTDAQRSELTPLTQQAIKLVLARTHQCVTNREAETRAATEVRSFLDSLPISEEREPASDHVGAVWPPLTERQQDIFEAARESPGLTQEPLAKKAGYECDSHFKADCALLVKLSLLRARCPGYVAN